MVVRPRVGAICSARWFPGTRSGIRAPTTRPPSASHTPYPGEASDVLRLELVPSERAYVETLTYAFPVIEKEEATLRLQWGTLGVNARIKAPYRPES